MKFYKLTAIASIGYMLEKGMKPIRFERTKNNDFIKVLFEVNKDTTAIMEYLRSDAWQKQRNGIKQARLLLDEGRKQHGIVTKQIGENGYWSSTIK